MRSGRYRTAWSVGWPFLLLCVLSASRWLVEGAFPATASTSLSEGTGCFFSGALLLLFGVTHRYRAVPHARSTLWTGTTGTIFVVFGAPLAGIIAGSALGANNAALATSLCPVVVAVCLAVSMRESEAGLSARMWPGLAGFAGLLLLLPEPHYAAWRTWMGLASLPLVLGLGAIMLGRVCQIQGRLDCMAAGSGLIAAGALLACLWFSQYSGAGSPLRISLSAAGLDGITNLLTLLALARAGTVMWSAQFLVIPLLSLGESLFVLRPFLNSRSVFGILLIALSAGYQILMTLKPAPSALSLGLQPGPGAQE